jgi:dTDP-4-dehydrorhamnose 3,5-epimerase
VSIRELPIEGACVMSAERHDDERGSFVRLWSRQDFDGLGILGTIDQSCLASNPVRWTLRGLHFQVRPHSESKLVSCVRGAIWDVIVDLRPTSKTFLRWHGEHLDRHGWSSLYVPQGCAHGYLTLEEDSLVAYQISGQYDPTSARGLHWGDPRLGIRWPKEPAVISARDASFPFVDGEASADWKF